jgi:hypothetical protein
MVFGGEIRLRIATGPPEKAALTSHYDVLLFGNLGVRRSRKCANLANRPVSVKTARAVLFHGKKSPLIVDTRAHHLCDQRRGTAATAAAFRSSSGRSKNFAQRADFSWPARDRPMPRRRRRYARFNTTTVVTPVDDRPRRS